MDLVIYSIFGASLQSEARIISKRAPSCTVGNGLDRSLRLSGPFPEILHTFDMHPGFLLYNRGKYPVEEIVMIYLVEDDSSIQELVLYTLNSSGMEARGFGAPRAFWQAMEQETPQLIMLDIMLPEEDGLQILRKIRASSTWKNIPVMMLTAKGTEYDKVIGLDAGADDYVPKPFGMMELLARVRALLRRSFGREPRREYTVGPLYVCPQRHVVTVNGREVTLTLKEYEVLKMLLENLDMVLTRDQLLNRVWGYSFDGESRTVDVHIRTLRQKLGEAGELIETVRGVGYKIGARP